jgi:hypothetical protein
MAVAAVVAAGMAEVAAITPTALSAVVVAAAVVAAAAL